MKNTTLKKINNFFTVQLDFGHILLYTELLKKIWKLTLYIIIPFAIGSILGFLIGEWIQFTLTLLP